MRKPRVKADGITAIYHVTSRITGGDFFIEDEICKNFLLDLLFRLAIFMSIKIVSSSIMDNHTHFVLEVPPSVSIEDDEELVKKVETYYGLKHPESRALRKALDHGPLSGKVRQRWLKRMGDISQFMKTLNQVFAQWYNRRHERDGHVWGGRFHSEMVQEKDVTAVVRMAQYVDLNSVRAGLSGDPADYRWSGYGMAVRGDQRGMAGLLRFLDGESFEEKMRNYRKGLFSTGAVARKENQAVISPERVEEVMREGGKLPASVMREVKLSAMKHGVFFGKREWVEEMFETHLRKYFRRDRPGAFPVIVEGGFYTARKERPQDFEQRPAKPGVGVGESPAPPPVQPGVPGAPSG